MEVAAVAPSERSEVSRKAWYSTEEEPALLVALQAVRFCTGSSGIRQPRFQTRPELPEKADVRLTRTYALPLRAGRGGLWPSVHSPRLRMRLLPGGSGAPRRADFARWLTVRLRGRWGLSTSASPPPDAPRGLRAQRDHVHQHRLQWAL